MKRKKTFRKKSPIVGSEVPRQNYREVIAKMINMFDIVQNLDSVLLVLAIIEAKGLRLLSL
jgi:hypothetical protein